MRLTISLIAIDATLPERWLAEAPVVAAQVPEREHLHFLVRLLTSLQRQGIDLSEHWDCLLEALILEKM